MSTAGVPSRPQSSALQLSGLRTLATTWSKLPSRLSLHIVLGHFAAEPRGLTTRFFSRGHVAVSLYIVLSGFVTHLAYAAAQLTLQPKPNPNPSPNPDPDPDPDPHQVPLEVLHHVEQHVQLLPAPLRPHLAHVLLLVLPGPL
eukprot:scaffold39862_cov66-Phaeocystis_antarctica.AAC.4